MIGGDARKALTDEQRNRMWYWRAVAGLNVSEDASDKRKMKAFKNCLKTIAEEDGAKKRAVFDGIRAHIYFVKQEKWVLEMHRKFPRLNTR